MGVFPQISQIFADCGGISTPHIERGTGTGEAGKGDQGSGVSSQGSVGKEAGKGLPALPCRLRGIQPTGLTCWAFAICVRDLLNLLS
jgi:hypothetical protein